MPHPCASTVVTRFYDQSSAGVTCLRVRRQGLFFKEEIKKWKWLVTYISSTLCICCFLYSVPGLEHKCILASAQDKNNYQYLCHHRHTGFLSTYCFCVIENPWHSLFPAALWTGVRDNWVPPECWIKKSILGRQNRVMQNNFQQKNVSLTYKMWRLC
jgi:hypothetical protein